MSAEGISKVPDDIWSENTRPGSSRGRWGRERKTEVSWLAEWRAMAIRPMLPPR